MADGAVGPASAALVSTQTWSGTARPPGVLNDFEVEGSQTAAAFRIEMDHPGLFNDGSVRGTSVFGKLEATIDVPGAKPVALNAKHRLLGGTWEGSIEQRGALDVAIRAKPSLLTGDLHGTIDVPLGKDVAFRFSDSGDGSWRMTYDPPGMFNETVIEGQGEISEAQQIALAAATYQHYRARG